MRTYECFRKKSSLTSTNDLAEQPDRDDCEGLEQELLDTLLLDDIPKISLMWTRYACKLVHAWQKTSPPHSALDDVKLQVAAAYHAVATATVEAASSSHGQPQLLQPAYEQHTGVPFAWQPEQMGHCTVSNNQAAESNDCQYLMEAAAAAVDSTTCSSSSMAVLQVRLHATPL